MGGGRKNRVKFISLILASSLAFSGIFFSCANASGGGGSSNEDNPPSKPVDKDPTTSSTSQTTPVSSARWSCATSEAETSLGNKVSEVLCLFDENKFELQKNISYSDENESISFFQTFYKGTYTGYLNDGIKFNIEEELDTNAFDNEMSQVFNLNAETQSVRLASNSTSRSAASRNVAAILADCQEKLKNVKFKKAEDKNISLETKDNSFIFTDTDNNEKEVSEKVVDGIINLEGFFFTGNPCNTRAGTSEWHWANTEEEGAKVLEKTADGKWTCQFRADDKDTLIRLFWNDWAVDWGLSSIDKEKARFQTEWASRTTHMP